jgi:hypothetical protein
VNYVGRKIGHCSTSRKKFSDWLRLANPNNNPDPKDKGGGSNNMHNNVIGRQQPIRKAVPRGAILLEKSQKRSNEDANSHISQNTRSQELYKENSSVKSLNRGGGDILIFRVPPDGFILKSAKI